jgi:hypothetical protein
MRMFKNSLYLVFVFGVLALMPGCKKKPPQISPLSGGFGIGASWIGVDSGPSASLYFTDQNSNVTMIWPFFGPASGDISISNDIAFFVADLPDDQGRVGSGAYFAVQGPGPVLNVSKDLLKIWSDSNHWDFAKIMNRYSPLNEESVSNGILLDYLGWHDEPQADFVVSWEQISNIVQDVRRTGKRHVTTPPATVYLRKDYGDIQTNSEIERKSVR